MKDKNYIPVKDNKGWYRDPDSGGIVNMNNGAREKYRERREKINKRNKAAEDRDRKLEELETKLDNLTEMFTQFLAKNKD